MKKKLIISAVALLAMPLMAAEAEQETTQKTDYHSTASCRGQDKCDIPSPCKRTEKGISCADQEWLNIDTVTLEAANGDPLAQYTLAYLTENGPDGTGDAAKAKDLYSKAAPALEEAAKKGDKNARMALAHMYCHGKGVKEDKGKAKALLKGCKGKGCEAAKPQQQDAPAASGDKAAEPKTAEVPAGSDAASKEADSAAKAE